MNHERVAQRSAGSDSARARGRVDVVSSRRLLSRVTPQWVNRLRSATDRRRRRFVSIAWNSSLPNRLLAVARLTRGAAGRREHSVEESIFHAAKQEARDDHVHAAALCARGRLRPPPCYLRHLQQELPGCFASFEVAVRARDIGERVNL